MVSADLVFSRSLSKRQRWDFYDPHYYCVWALLSLLQAAESHGLPALYPQVCRFSAQTTHANPTSWPRLKNCRTKKGRWRALQPPVSHSTAALCLVLSTRLAQWPLQLRCCLGTSLRWAEDCCPPLSETWTFLKTRGPSCRCGGAMTIGLCAANTILSRVPAFWPSFFSFILVLDVIFLQCILFSICGTAFTLTVQLPLKTDCLISAATSNKMRMESDSNSKGGKMWIKWCKKLILCSKASLNIWSFNSLTKSSVGRGSEVIYKNSLTP